MRHGSDLYRARARPPLPLLPSKYIFYFIIDQGGCPMIIVLDETVRGGTHPVQQNITTIPVLLGISWRIPLTVEAGCRWVTAVQRW